MLNAKITPPRAAVGRANYFQTIGAPYLPNRQNVPNHSLVGFVGFGGRVPPLKIIYAIVLPRIYVTLATGWVVAQ